MDKWVEVEVKVYRNNQLIKEYRDLFEQDYSIALFEELQRLIDRDKIVEIDLNRNIIELDDREITVMQKIYDRTIVAEFEYDNDEYRIVVEKLEE